MKEKIKEAADILQEVQVETFGAMEKEEKTEFILEQMRLCLAKKDPVRTQILSNKISKKMLGEKGMEHLKIRFYRLMIQYYAHEKKYLEICKAYQQIYNTPTVQSDSNQWKPALTEVVIYSCLSPHDNEQSDLLNRINEDKNLQQLPPYKVLISLFLKQELMRWSQLENSYKAELNSHPEFTELIEGKNPFWVDFRKRVVEHNIRVIAQYYSQISSNRLSQLLDLSRDEAERFISDLVSGKTIFAKIDRPKGIISFKKRQDPNEFLTDWSGNINQLLKLLENTCHLIHRENMVHKIENKA